MKNLKRPKNKDAYGRQKELRFTDLFSSAFHPTHAMLKLWQNHIKSRILQTRKGVQRVLLHLLLSLPGREQRRERKPLFKTILRGIGEDYSYKLEIIEEIEFKIPKKTQIYEIQ